MGRCTPSQYGMGLLAAQGLLRTMSANSGEVPSEEQHNLQSDYKHDAQVAIDFLDLAAASTIRELIATGEGKTTEFKSTLRWDTHENRKNPALEQSTLKTIAAFLDMAHP